MDEKDWIACEKPRKMWQHLIDRGIISNPPTATSKIITWANACNSRFRQLFPDKPLEWLEWQSVGIGRWINDFYIDGDVTFVERCHMLREVFGNPFRPVKIFRGTIGKDNRCCCNAASYCPLGKAGSQYRCTKAELESGGVSVVEWLTPTVLSMAQDIYGNEDWEALPILADPLEEAGCNNEDILRHLRGFERCPECVIYGNQWFDCPLCDGKGWVTSRGPHLQGCWALDLILIHGKVPVV